jgi:hypothetical protein
MPESTSKSDIWVKVGAIATVLSVLVAVVALLVTSHHPKPVTQGPLTSASSKATEFTSSAEQKSTSYSSGAVTNSPSVGGTPELALDPASGVSGQSVVAHLTGFAPNSSIRISFQGQYVGEATSNAGGSATFSFVVPAGYDSFAGDQMTVQASDSQADTALQNFTIT